MYRITIKICGKQYIEQTEPNMAAAVRALNMYIESFGEEPTVVYELKLLEDNTDE